MSASSSSSSSAAATTVAFPETASFLQLVGMNSSDRKEPIGRAIDTAVTPVYNHLLRVVVNKHLPTHQLDQCLRFVKAFQSSFKGVSHSEFVYFSFYTAIVSGLKIVKPLCTKALLELTQGKPWAQLTESQQKEISSLITQKLKEIRLLITAALPSPVPVGIQQPAIGPVVAQNIIELQKQLLEVISALDTILERSSVDESAKACMELLESKLKALIQFCKTDGLQVVKELLPTLTCPHAQKIVEATIEYIWHIKAACFASIAEMVLDECVLPPLKRALSMISSAASSSSSASLPPSQPGIEQFFVSPFLQIARKVAAIQKFEKAKDASQSASLATGAVALHGETAMTELRLSEEAQTVEMLVAA
ncbi:MAG TPA: hypothetical protein VN457_06410, partial [Chlamydiales bacterium]|nr:hypothetical protein [Chlamydiales bacterium]